MQAGAIIGDGDRKSWDPRGAMIWDNVSIFRTNCAILTSCIRADARTCRGLSRGCCHVAWSTGESCARGGYLTKFNTGRLRPEVQPLTLLYTILAEKVPLLYPFIEERCPFHIPTLEQCTSFLSPWNKVNGQYYLALINRAGGLYGRILTEVVSTDRTQWGLYTRPRSRFSHTDPLSSVNKMFIIWQKQEQFNSFQETGWY